MISCDILRALLMGTAAIPHLPVPAVLAALFATALFSAPFDAARSATLPAVLPGERYVVGVGLIQTTAQPVQIIGYLSGATIATISPSVALGFNAATFVASALMVGLWVQHREPALARDRRTHLMRETWEGFRLVFGTPKLRVLVLVVFGSALIAILPEGLGAPWAAQIAPSGQRGLDQGLIMAAVPFGSIFGALWSTRFVRPANRIRLLGPLAVLTPLALVGTVISPPVAVVVTLAAITGFTFGGLGPIANGEFVKALPNEYRARAFGVVSGGLQIIYGGAVLTTGAIAAHTSHIGTVVGLWSLLGVMVMLVLIRPWSAARLPEVTGRVPSPVPGTMEG
jgi:hypothetical protein